MTIPRIEPYAPPLAAQLPASRAPFTPDPARAVLLVHDMQAYFAAFYGDGQEPLASALANMQRLVGACRAAGIPVIFSAQPTTQHGRGLLSDMWGPGLPARPELGGFLPNLAPQTGDLQVEKTRYSAFVGTELERRIRDAGAEQLWICGVYAHIGCLATALDAFMRDIQPLLVADALADFSRAHHDQALALAANCCATVLGTERVLQAIGGDDPLPALVRAELARLLEVSEAEVTPDADLRDLGVDSVRMMELLEYLDEQGYPVAPEEMLECVTLADLLDALRAGAG